MRIAFGYHQTSARKVSRKMQLNSLLSPTRRRCLFGSSPAMQTLKRLLATDILALASMKNVATWNFVWIAESREPLSLWTQVTPNPSGRGHVCLGVTNYCTRLAKIRGKDARSVSTCGGEFNSRHIAGRSGPKILDDPKSSMWPQVRRDHPWV